MRWQAGCLHGLWQLVQSAEVLAAGCRLVHDYRVRPGAVRKRCRTPSVCGGAGVSSYCGPWPSRIIWTNGEP